MSARDTPKQVRTRASEREPGSPYVAGGPRSMASKVAVNRLRKEYRCLPRIAAPRIAVLPQSTPRHLLRRPATVATAVTVATVSLAASSAALPATATGASNRRRSFAPRRSRATCRSGTTCCRAHLTHLTRAGCNTAHGQKCPGSQQPARNQPPPQRPRLLRVGLCARTGSSSLLR